MWLPAVFHVARELGPETENNAGAACTALDTRLRDALRNTGRTASDVRITIETEGPRTIAHFSARIDHETEPRSIRFQIDGPPLLDE